MDTNGNSLPEMFGYDNDEFVTKFDDLYRAAQNCENDSELVRCADLLAEDKMEAILLTWCVAKAGLVVQAAASNELFDKMMDIVSDSILAIEDDDIRLQLCDTMLAKMIELKDDYDKSGNEMD